VITRRRNKTIHRKQIVMGCKLVLVVRKDLNMGVGKIASQCSHASVMAYQKSSNLMLLKWSLSGHKKVVVECPDEKTLFDIRDKAKELRIMTNIVRDAGLTQVGPNTATVIAVGPAKEDLINQVTGHLRLL
jgi:PTH2 family peptidyl-tRNA hydrolase